MEEERKRGKKLPEIRDHVGGTVAKLDASRMSPPIFSNQVSALEKHDFEDL
jgi:hypothetical protein